MDIITCSGIVTERITVSRIVGAVSCWLISAVIVSDGAGASDAAIYDGENTTGKLRLDLTAVSGGMNDGRFSHPVYMHRGIYVNIGSNVTSVLVQYVRL